MAAITTWTRLEPRVRGDDLTPSLEARVHDPLWMLGRQWQLGEFVGEDAGTPVQVSMQVQAEPLVAFRTGSEEGDLDPSLPLDCLAGAEPKGDPCLGERAEAGAEFLQLLVEAGCSAAGVEALVGNLRLPSPDPGRITSQGEALLFLTAGRLPDGAALVPLLEDIASSGQVDPTLELTGADSAAAVSAARAWLAWCDGLVQQAPASTWVDPHLDHQFDLAAQPPGGSAYALSATAWKGGRLDWYDLEVAPQATPPTRSGPAAPLPGVDPSTGTLSREGLPVALGYPGMPASRWWQFEDANVNFAQITAQPADLARMLAVEFASVYSNDWYLWPLVLPMGAVHRVTRLEVGNTFGDRITVEPVAMAAGGSATADWQLFRPCGPGAAGAYDGLLLPPTLASVLEGEILEEVRLFRDEMANLAWAVETTVVGQDGLPFDRHGATADGGQGPVAPDSQSGSEQPLEYRLETDVPAYWFPLVPDPNGKPIFYRRVLRRIDDTGVERDLPPWGRLLAPDDLWLWQEEVPREGARVVRRYHLARDGDGRLRLWLGRRSGAGRGEGASGLRFDDALDRGASP